MNIIFGGTFDPIHNGHLLIAKAAHQRCPDSRIIFMPAPNPPHREQPIASPADRLAMTRLATAPVSFFEVSNIEYRREGVSYTSDTIKTFRATNPDESLGLLIGQDSYEQLHTWHDINYILSHATILVVSRSDTPIANNHLPPHQIERIVIPPCPISATKIRECVKQGESIEALVPSVIADYIKENKIYS